jgi:hypothetical protein
MVINMTVQNYLMINQDTNAVDNICLWDGNPDTWQPPAGYLVIPQATTMALVWMWDAPIKDWVLAQEMGGGQIGFTWSGTECITNQPKPEPPAAQPVSQGTQSL